MEEAEQVIDPPRYIRFTFIILLLLGCFAAFTGVADAFNAESFASRLFGVVLIVASVVLLSGAVRSITNDDGLPLSLAACFVGSLVGLMMLVVQLAGFDRDARILLWGAMILAPLICALNLLRKGVRTPKLKWMATVASTVLSVGFLQFWYTNQYLPATVRPSLTITTSIDNEGLIQDDKKQQMLALSVRTSVKNIGSTRIVVLGVSSRFGA